MGPGDVGLRADRTAGRSSCGGPSWPAGATGSLTCIFQFYLPPQVVLGSHMSGGLMQFMLGSVATHVAHHCRRPVAVLH